MQKSIHDYSSVLDKIPKDELVRYLETYNYVVRKVDCTRACSLDGIIDYFYESLRDKRGDLHKYACDISKNYKRDRKALSEFQKQILKDNYSKKAASLFILDFIDRFFRYYDHIGLYEDIRSLSFLFSEKGGWIHHKIHELEKKDLNKLCESKEYEDLISSMCHIKDDSMDKFLYNKQKELLISYGKKEGR